MSSNYVARAQQYLQEAQKKSSGGDGFFSKVFGGGPDFYAASEAYGQAANCYKLAKQWDDAGNTYLQAAQCALRGKDSFEVAHSYIEAAKCYKKSNNLEKFEQCLKDGVLQYQDIGKFSMAARYSKELAELLENSNAEEACEQYMVAADLYETADQQTSVNQCLLKVAELSATLGNYERAIESFEKVAEESLKNKLLSYSVKEYFLKAGLCHLCTGDVVTSRRALERYQEQDYKFSAQRECELLNNIITAFENYDIDSFTNAVREFDSITRLDNWKTDMLLVIRKNIEASELDDDDEDLT
eukprot:TRINITY_DN70_c2_g1_i3.p1 TRINITY_DN70_c2_g1~~TRINITY_DN70_c2_g1_i3.p1  ORF type:complete len:300 (+),score=119.96 TRINITY_DN70_c2_g1_i3:122-1021(+)